VQVLAGHVLEELRDRPDPASGDLSGQPAGEGLPPHDSDHPEQRVAEELEQTAAQCRVGQPRSDRPAA
jgi:hypothetical protein